VIHYQILLVQYIMNISKERIQCMCIQTISQQNVSHKFKQQYEVAELNYM